MGHLLSVSDLSADEFSGIVRLASEVKKDPKKYRRALEDQSIVMLFEKPSTRTRISFELAMAQLGGHVVYLDSADTQIRRGETLADSARVLSRYADAVVARVMRHSTLTELSRNASIPIINGLSDLEHPCQIAADLQTVYENSGKLSGIKLAYAGDGNNVCNSLLLGCAMTGVNVSAATPKSHKPSPSIVEKAKALAAKTGSTVEICEDPKKAVEGADYVYTDVWVSMGDEAEEEKRKAVFKDYQINKELLSGAKKDVKVLHCLPAHRGMEITDEVIDGPASLVWDQAENRLHAQKAILLHFLSRE